MKVKRKADKYCNNSKKNQNKTTPETIFFCYPSANTVLCIYSFKNICGHVFVL